jgi:DNA-binding CsgD family transcriptional regulator
MRLDENTTIGGDPGAQADLPYIGPYRIRRLLRLVAKGLTVAEAAAALELSRHTVAGYLKEIYRKLRVGSRAEATLEAARRGLVSEP